MEPTSKEAVELARTSLSAGATDALRLLEVLRVSRAVSLDVVSARLALYEAWSALERACGAPLLRFDEEPGANEDAAREKGQEGP